MLAHQPDPVLSLLLLTLGTRDADLPRVRGVKCVTLQLVYRVRVRMGDVDDVVEVPLLARHLVLSELIL